MSVIDLAKQHKRDDPIITTEPAGNQHKERPGVAEQTMVNDFKPAPGLCHHPAVHQGALLTEQFEPQPEAVPVPEEPELPQVAVQPSPVEVTDIPLQATEIVHEPSAYEQSMVDIIPGATNKTKPKYPCKTRRMHVTGFVEKRVTGQVSVYQN